MWMTYFPSYAQWKAINYPGRKIMELTSKLKQQLTDGTDPSRYVKFMRTRLTFGTNYTNYDRVPGRPRSGRDRTRGADLGGVLNDGRSNYYPMDPREIFNGPGGDAARITKANIERIQDIALDHITGTVGP